VKAVGLRESEAQFQRAVLEAAQALGWTCYFAWKSYHSPKGYPDLTLVHPGRPGLPSRLCFAELKVGRRALTPEQAQWLALLGEVPGIEVYVWKPEAWPEILTVLQG
jgi:hypothetical protein